MKLAILDLCRPSPAFDRFGSTADLTRRWVARALPEATLTTVPVSTGATLPELRAFDGFALTGSEKGVYDETAWMAPLKAFLRAARGARRPIFGICFGHQIMAEAFGGGAKLIDAGYAAGARSYQGPKGAFTAHAMHQDQVTTKPPGATVIAHAPYCPIAALAYDFPALSVQFHPEYPPRVVTGGIGMLEGDLITAEQAEASRASMRAAAPREDLFRAEVASFFRSAIGGASGSG